MKFAPILEAAALLRRRNRRNILHHRSFPVARLFQAIKIDSAEVILATLKMPIFFLRRVIISTLVAFFPWWVSLSTLFIEAEKPPLWNYSITSMQQIKRSRVFSELICSKWLHSTVDGSHSTLHAVRWYILPTGHTLRRSHGVAFTTRPLPMQLSSAVQNASPIASSNLKPIAKNFHVIVATPIPGTSIQRNRKSTLSFSLRPQSTTIFQPDKVDGNSLSTKSASDNDGRKHFSRSENPSPFLITSELNPSQVEATLRPRYSITRVIAGPGAGKTKVLTCRIAHLLLSSYHKEQSNDGDSNTSQQHYSLDREGILAVTFTKKAASEMERRLTDLLAISSQLSESESISGSYKVVDEQVVRDENADPGDLNNDEASAIPGELMRRSTVGTFHSVCSKILRKFGTELRNLPSVRDCLGLDIISEADIGKMPSQKTQGVREGSYHTNETQFQTLDGSFNILDQSDQLLLLKDVLKEHHIDLKSSEVAAMGSRSNFAEIRPITILNAISLLNIQEATFSTLQAGARTQEISDEVSKKMSRKVRQIATKVRIPFQKLKYSRNSVDFDDLILLTRELLLHDPVVRESLHRRWRHILVDEFQDTSQVQLDLVRLLTTDSLFVVGDGDQSIYSWRGASPESMSDFEVAFHGRVHGWLGLLENHDIDLAQYLQRINGSHTSNGKDNACRPSLLEVKTVYLMENYRSTTNIVKAAQKVISSREKTGFRFSANEGNGAITMSSQDGIRRDMKPMRGTGPSPRVLACKDGKAEGKGIRPCTMLFAFS